MKAADENAVESRRELPTRHFVSLRDYSEKDLTALLDRADELKIAWKDSCMPRSLWNKRVALWFYGNGFRNRVAFELGAKALGAAVSFIPGELGVQEPIEDIAGYLRNWFDILVIRAKRHQDLLRVVADSPIPVINARTDRSHPCEIMGDLQYIRQQKGTLDGMHLVFVGEATNICLSWLEAAAVLPLKVTQVCPAGYEADLESLRALRQNARGEVGVSNDLNGSLAGADVLYTDCWPKAGSEADAQRIQNVFLPYQIGLTQLSILGEKGIFLPCPPVRRGREVSSTAMNSTQCKNFEAKDNLLHVQNAIMEFVV